MFDEHGNLFTGDNDSDQGDMERLVYVVEGGDSGWRVGYQFAPLGKGGPWIKDGLWKPAFPGRPAYLLPPVCNIEDGPSGLTYYPGTGLDPKYAGHFFITHFKGSIARSGIQTYTLKRNGATFAPTSSQQFMGGVLPTDVTFGPDGKFYVLDWVDGWPKSTKGRIYDITPANPDPAQVKISADLAKLLATGFTGLSNRRTHGVCCRIPTGARASRRSSSSRRAATEAGASSNAGGRRASPPRRSARLHAVWGLTQLGRAERPKVGADAASGCSATRTPKFARRRPKAWAISATPRRSAPLGEEAQRSRNPACSSSPRRASASCATSAATPELLALLNRNDNKDAYIRHAAAHALARIGKNAALDAGVRDTSAAVRLGVLLAFRELRDANVAWFLEDSDAYIVREAAIAINDAPVEAAFGALAAKLDAAPINDDGYVTRAINANYRLGAAANAKALAQYATRGGANAGMRAEALLQLGLWGKVAAARPPRRHLSPVAGARCQGGARKR